MKKRSKHKAKKALPPMLVMRGLCNNEIETVERMAVQAFSLGFATEHHFDTLLDMASVLLLAGCTSKARAPAQKYAKDVFIPVLNSIKARKTRTGKFGVNAEELKVLKGFVSSYRDFWLHQPTELYVVACDQLQAHYSKAEYIGMMEAA